MYDVKDVWTKELIGVCTDTYVFYQSVLEKKDLWIANLINVYHKKA